MNVMRRWILCILLAFVCSSATAADRVPAGHVMLLTGQATALDANGSALIIHAAPDDFRTDPTGNSGARIACGVIK